MSGKNIFQTIRGKIIFFVALVMVAITMVNIYFTMHDVGNAMLLAQENSARNILHSLDLMLRDDYQNLLKDKRSMTLSKRARLKNAALMIESVLKGFSVSGEKKSGTRGLGPAIKWLGAAPLNDVDYFLMDKASHILFSSSEAITGETYRHIKDIKQRNVAEAMSFENLKEKGDYAIYRAEDQEGNILAYFLPFKPWEVTIAVSIDVGDIEAEAHAKKEKIITSLTEYAKQLTLTKNGFVLMVDEEHTLLLPPPPQFESQAGKMALHMTENRAVQAVKTSSPYAISRISLASGTQDKSEPMMVYSSYFKPLKWYMSVMVPVREINRPARELVGRQSLIITLIFMVGLAAVFILVTRIATPLNQLSLYAIKLPKFDFSKPLEEKSPIDHLPEKYRDEVGALASSFILMREELNRNIQNLVKATASRQAIESELNIAREIQLGMVPKTFPSFPGYREFDLYATLKPAKEIGGDLYDFFLIDEDHLCFTLGDVSDKGIPAALFMVVTRTLIRTLSENQDSPAGMMQNINNTLSADNPRCMFVTLVIGVLNIRTGEIKYANGGHNPPILISREDEVSYISADKEALVGAMPDLAYTDRTLHLKPGESFFLYTDGVTEAMNPEEVQYSEERLLSDIEACRPHPPEQTVEAVLESVKIHAGTAAQSDDIAMLMITYRGDGDGSPV